MAEISIDELREALSNFSTPNNELLRNAVVYVKQFLKTPNSIGHILKVFQVDDRIQVCILFFLKSYFSMFKSELFIRLNILQQLY